MQDMFVDQYGRRISSLRISLTERCNLRCIFCHNEGQLGSGGEITVAEVAQIARVCAAHGVDKVKFSGGEPLLRKDFEEVLRALPPLKDVSATTNGILLAGRAQSLKASGLDRVNVSLSSLDEVRFRRITRCDDRQFGRVLEGIEAAVEAGLTPVKVNMVYLKGINDDEVDRLIAFVRGKPLVLQIIELMDFKGAFEYHGDVAALEERIKAQADRAVQREMHRRTKYYLAGAEVEIVRPIDNSEFCMHCNRLRVTSDCKLKPCLLRSDNLVSVRGLSDEAMEQTIRRVVAGREPFFKKADLAASKPPKEQTSS